MLRSETGALYQVQVGTGSENKGDKRIEWSPCYVLDDACNTFVLAIYDNERDACARAAMSASLLPLPSRTQVYYRVVAVTL